MVLQAIRDRLHGIIAIFIFAILIIPFAFVGVNSYFTADAVNAVAVVNDQEITISQYNTAFQNYRRRMQAQLGAEFDAAAYESLTVRREFLDQMINEELVAQVSMESGLAVSDEVVGATIRGLAGFEVDGQFNIDVYQQRLAARGQTPAQFEQEVRSSLVLEQFPNVIAQSAIATQWEIEDYARLSEEKRSFSAIVVPAFPASEVAVDGESADSDGEAEAEQAVVVQNDAPVSDEAVQAWYDENRGMFMSPEMVVVEYLELDSAQLGGAMEPDEEQLRARFEDQEARFITPEARLASHILIEVSNDAPQAEIDTARQQAEDLAARARDGEDFAALATENSQDLGSIEQGGDLGWIEPGYMVKTFEDGLYELTLENPLSAPIQSGYGWHVIYLRDIRPAEGMTYAEARELLLTEYQSEANELRFLEQADRMIDIIYQDPTTLNAAADELGLEIQEAGPFGRAGSPVGVTANGEFVQASFSDLVLGQRAVSDPVDLGENHIVLILLKEHMPEAFLPLEGVRDVVVENVRREQQLALASGQANELLERANAGEAIPELAAEAGLEVVGTEDLSRHSTDYDDGFMRSLFKVKGPADDEPVRTILEMEQGYAVVQLDSVTPGSLDGENAMILNIYFNRQIGNAGASTETMGFVRMLRDQSEVTVFEDRL